MFTKTSHPFIKYNQKVIVYKSLQKLLRLELEEALLKLGGCPAHPDLIVVSQLVDVSVPEV